MKYLVYLNVRTLWMPADQIKKKQPKFPVLLQPPRFRIYQLMFFPF